MAKDYLRIALHPDDPRYEAKETGALTTARIFNLVYAELSKARHNLSPKADLPTPGLLSLTTGANRWR